MHIPDGFVSLPTSLGAAAVAAGGVGVSVRLIGRTLRERQLPLAGLAAAFIFVLQMLNFPVAAGTSGHVLGAALAAVLLGPWLAVVVLTTVVAVQALVFADGGISALGLNVLNIAVVGVLVGWLVFRGIVAILPKTARSIVVATAIGAWCAVVASSAGFAAEYALGGSGAVPATTVLGAMTGVHALIGIGEGIASAAVVAAVLASRPDLVEGARVVGVRHATRVKVGPRPITAFAVVATLVAGFLLAVVAPRASTAPDGLERVAVDHGIAGSPAPGTGELP